MFGFETFAANTSLVTMCFRNRTIEVVFYLRNNYIAAGATDGPCVTSSQ